MVRQHEERRVLIELGKDFAEYLIDLLIKFFERASILRGGCGVVGWVLGVGQPPQHVRIEIEAGKIEEKQAIVKLRELYVESPPVFGENSARLLQIFVII